MFNCIAGCLTINFAKGDPVPRSARKKSNTGIYHIVLRGINKQNVFLDNEDSSAYLHTLAKFREQSGYEIYAYCLMSNHIHLLMKEGSESLSIAFRRIGASFVYWYNHKYDRVGHLFQDRFISEAVETDSYLLTVMRYIHQNPLQAGMIKALDEYKWSSYSEYKQKPLLCNTSFILNYFSTNPKEALSLWDAFNQEKCKDQCLDYNNRRLSDKEAVQLIKDITEVNDLNEINSFIRHKKLTVIKALKEAGLSIRQIERLTDMSFNLIRKA